LHGILRECAAMPSHRTGVVVGGVFFGLLPAGMGALGARTRACSRSAVKPTKRPPSTGSWPARRRLRRCVGALPLSSVSPPPPRRHHRPGLHFFLSLRAGGRALGSCVGPGAHTQRALRAPPAAEVGRCTATRFLPSSHSPAHAPRAPCPPRASSMAGLPPGGHCQAGGAAAGGAVPAAAAVLD
jgi:hypothetical protein